jgi:hypothetical protein
MRRLFVLGRFQRDLDVRLPTGRRVSRVLEGRWCAVTYGYGCIAIYYGIIALLHVSMNYLGPYDAEEAAYIPLNLIR